MKIYLRLVIAGLLLLPLTACKRKIPVTVYANYGHPCPTDELSVDHPLTVSATIGWKEGSASGTLVYYGPNMRHTGFTVDINEGSIVGVAGNGYCCCYPEKITNTLVYSESATFWMNTTGAFSQPHFYVVFYSDGIDMYYE